MTFQIEVGKGLGKKIMTEIEKAKQSVLILSPYISQKFVDKLIEIQHKKIEVHLISHENRLSNKIPLTFKNNFLALIGLLLIISIATLTTYYISNLDFITLVIIAKTNLKYTALTVIIFLLLTIFIISNFTKKNLKNYDFNYTILKQTKHFVHTKLFIIDNRIAFLGSINFTFNGFYRNDESVIKITDKATIKYLTNYFFSLKTN